MFCICFREPRGTPQAFKQHGMYCKTQVVFCRKPENRTRFSAPKILARRFSAGLEDGLPDADLALAAREAPAPEQAYGGSNFFLTTSFGEMLANFERPVLGCI